MIHLASLVVAFAGFVLLCAAMQRHQAEIVGARLTPVLGLRLRLSGGALLLASWLIDAIGLGWAVGSVTALGHFTLAAGLAIAALHWRAARRRKAVASQH